RGKVSEAKRQSEAGCLASTLTGGPLGGFSAGDEMNDQRNDRKQKQQVNQSAGNVEHQKSAKPKDQQQNRNSQERSKSHVSSGAGVVELKQPRNLLRQFLRFRRFQPYTQRCKVQLARM